MEGESLLRVARLDTKYGRSGYGKERIGAIVVKCMGGFALLLEYIELISARMINGNSVGRGWRFKPQGIYEGCGRITEYRFTCVERFYIFDFPCFVVFRQ